MAKLGDVRRRFPPEDPAAYEKAYEEAKLAEELGTLVYSLRAAAGLSEAELAARMGIDEDEVVRAEEGDASLTVAFLDGVAGAVDLPAGIALKAGSLEVTLEPPEPAAPQPDD